MIRPQSDLGFGGVTIAHDKRSRREIAEALRVLGGNHGDEPGSVEKREEIDQANRVADRGGEKRDRTTLAINHSDPGGLLAGGLTAQERFEHEVVPEHDDEDCDQEPGARETRVPDCSPDQQQGDHGAELDQRVEQAGEEAGADPDDGHRDPNTFGCRDLDVVVDGHAETVDQSPDMDVETFTRDRQTGWDELRVRCDRAGRRPDRLPPDEIRQLGEGYRSAAADLEYARRRYPSTPTVARLEALVAAARPLVYPRGPQTTTFRAFVTTGYWRRVCERPGAVLVAALALFGPMVMTAYWAWEDPAAASGLVPEMFQGVTEPKTEGDDLGLSVDQQAEFSTQIFTNNIRVTAMAFGAGVLLGVGALYFLAYNGVVIGAVIGLAIDAGNTRPMFALILAHGVLELSCIVVGGAAGLRMGWAIVAPGLRSRGDALRREARAAVEMMMGTAAWLVIAGLIEGFITPSGMTVASASAIGGSVGAIFWILVIVRGRRPIERDRWGRRISHAIVKDARVTSA